MKLYSASLPAKTIKDEGVHVKVHGEKHPATAWMRE
jgi:hypothetical protein